MPNLPTLLSGGPIVGVAPFPSNDDAPGYTMGDQAGPPQVAVLTNSRIVTVHQENNGGSWGAWVGVFEANSVTPVRGWINLPGGAHDFAPQVTALTGGGFAVTWVGTGTTPGPDGVFVQFFDNAGNALSSATRAETLSGSFSGYFTDFGDPGYQPWQDLNIEPKIVALDNGNAVVVYGKLNYTAGNPTNGVWDVYAQVFSPAGAKIGTEQRVADGFAPLGSMHFAVPDVVALPGGGFTVTFGGSTSWTSNSIYVRSYDGNGAPTTGVVQVSQPGQLIPLSDPDNPGFQAPEDLVVQPRVTALDNGGYVVVYGTTNSFSDASFADWTLQGYIANPDLPGLPPYFGIGSNGFRQFAPVISTLDNGNFVVAWLADGFGPHNTALFARVFSPTGAALTGEIRVDPGTGPLFWADNDIPGIQPNEDFPSEPRILALPDGGFAVAYSQTLDNNNWDLFLQVFDNAGLAIGSRLPLNQGGFQQYWPSLAAAPNGDIVATWLVDNSGLALQTIKTGLSPTEGADDILGSAHADSIDLLGSNDTYVGGGGNDTITGGTGADSLYGDGGDDVFILTAAGLVAGEIIDGGADSDTLRIEGGGTVDLTGVTLTSIEAIHLSNSTGTTVIVANAAQAALVTGAGANDQVELATGGAGPTTGQVKALIDAGVEVVTWSIPGYATVVAEAEPGGFHIHYTDTPGDGVNHQFATIDTHFNAAGQATHQSQVFDSPGSVGTIANHTFDPATGLATQVKYLDGGSNRTFDTITTTLVNGVKQSVRTVNDNNTATLTDDTIVDQEFSGGQVVREITQDTGGSKPWSQVVREYENDGVLYTTTQVFRTFWDSSPNQHVAGTAGSQLIEGGSGNDALLGGAGADTFSFSPDFGQDTIFDFVNGTDKLDLTAFGIDTIEELDVVATITQAGTNTVIQFDGTDERITIRGLTKADLGAGDFVISA